LRLPAPETWVWLRQVHGATVVTVDGSPDTPPEADGAVTARAGLPIAICTADCAPIALDGDHVIGAVHAGWAGLEAGVVEATVDAMRTAGAGEIRATLGPCARPERYAFGADLLARLVARFGAGVASTTVAGDPALDIPTAVRIALDREGVRLDDLGVDTIVSPDHFSHRRDGGTGRQAMVVVMTA